MPVWFSEKFSKLAFVCPYINDVDIIVNILELGFWCLTNVFVNMDEMKQLYVLEWFGPYKFVEDLWEDGRTSDCSIYLITGREKYERTIGYIKYVGITERDVAIRLKDKYHLEKQSKLLNKKYWSARFSRTPKTKFRKSI